MNVSSSGITPCDWCGQSDKSNVYILPLRNGRHVFCSELCLFEYLMCSEENKIVFAQENPCCWCGHNENQLAEQDSCFALKRKGMK